MNCMSVNDETDICNNISIFVTLWSGWQCVSTVRRPTLTTDNYYPFIVQKV